MAGLILVVIVRFIAEVVAAVVRSARKARQRSICITCAFAHVQHKTRGRIAISCTFGGLVRPMQLDVLQCTDFRGRPHLNRTAPIGFGSVLDRKRHG
jgi:hypothetical protein